MDLEGIRRASRAIWQKMAAGWDARHALLEEAARPVTERMLERLAPAAGQTVLDLAAGSGVAGLAAAPLVAPGGRVIISDFAPAMVEAAARRAAALGLDNVECRVLDAERLALADGSVDGVLCRWGYMLMADPAAAVAETRRVLRAGGRVAAAVFSGPEENAWAALPARVLEELGHLPPSPPGTPGILALADRERLRGLFTGAGFSSPVVEAVPFSWRFAGFDDYWSFLAEAAGAIAALLERLDAPARARVREELAARAGAGPVDLSAVSLVVSAAA